ncbi:hypothetical protein CPB83DRAFT_899532 [Crepidotus variabilis]|uniref:Uncharacterized protein n=1 Tax=Crepidotus variabilis TaxID=179855 RepID=A0A9P6JIT5_9AGAR|nr:hypothetical protein CPB83DRAFT_899532 [Crepidotus variabilis]
MNNELLRRGDLLFSTFWSSTSVNHPVSPYRTIPGELYSPLIIHPTTWGTFENLANSAETRKLDRFLWPLTLKAFSAFRNGGCIIYPSVASNPEQVSAFRFLDDNKVARCPTADDDGKLRCVADLDDEGVNFYEDTVSVDGDDEGCLDVYEDAVEEQEEALERATGTFRMESPGDKPHKLAPFDPIWLLE